MLLRLQSLDLVRCDQSESKIHLLQALHEKVFMNWLFKPFLKLWLALSAYNKSLGCSLTASKRYVFASPLFQKKPSPQNTNSETRMLIKHARDYVTERKARADQRSSQHKRWKCSVVYSCFACNEPANGKFRLCWEQGHKMENRRRKNMSVVWWNDPPLVLHADLQHHRSSWKLSVTTAD